MEPLREVSAATSRVKVLDKEIAGAKRVLARLEAKKAKEIEAIEGFKADAIAEKERRDFSRSQGHQGQDLLTARKSLPRVRKDLEWLQKHLKDLQERRKTKGESERAWARRRIPEIKRRIKEANEVVAKAKAKAAEAEQRKPWVPLPQELLEAANGLEELRRRRRKEARQRVKAEKTLRVKGRDDYARHIEHHECKMGESWRVLYVKYWVYNGDWIGSHGPLPWRYFTHGIPEP
jgi:hypothetical protein